MITRIQDRPSVSGTNRKWYMAVAANCRRDRLTTSSRGVMVHLGGKGGGGKGQQVLLDALWRHAHVFRLRGGEESLPQPEQQQALEQQRQRDGQREGHA